MQTIQKLHSSRKWARKGTEAMMKKERRKKMKGYLDERREKHNNKRVSFKTGRRRKKSEIRREIFTLIIDLTFRPRCTEIKCVITLCFRSKRGSVPFHSILSRRRNSQWNFLARRHTAQHNDENETMRKEGSRRNLLLSNFSLHPKMNHFKNHQAKKIIIKESFLLPASSLLSTRNYTIWCRTGRDGT